MAEEEFATHRNQIEAILNLVDEYGLSELDRDRLGVAVRGQPVARYDNPHASDIAARLQEALKEADSAELRALVYERLPASL